MEGGDSSVAQIQKCVCLFLNPVHKILNPPGCAAAGSTLNNQQVSDLHGLVVLESAKPVQEAGWPI